MTTTSVPHWCYILINKEALYHNLAVIQRHCPHEQIVAMLKSNSYGHAAVSIAQLLQRAGVSRFGVATLQEAIQLRDAGITGTILLSGAGWLLQTEELIARRITPLLSDAQELDAVVRHVQSSCIDGSYAVHLKIDTGMSRMGIAFDAQHPTMLLSVLQQLQQTPRLQLQGMCTHFAHADVKNKAAMQQQLQRFAAAVQLAQQQGLQPTVLHVANSAAILQGYCNAGQQSVLNNHNIQWWIRPGGALYGLNSMTDDPTHCPFKPVLSWHAPVVLRKRIKKGDRVGYAGTWTAPRDTQLAVLAVGYGDGYARLLSNRGHVLIAGSPAPIIGNISMDLTTVDVTNIYQQQGPDSCRMGATATLIGQQGQHNITAWNLAHLCHTIPYEICTRISSRVPRYCVDHLP
ncbi:MAG: alanine racemase [Myxococcota bacterium]